MLRWIEKLEMMNFFASSGEINSSLEDDIDCLMNNLDTEIVLKESLGNELDSDDEPLKLLVPEANYHVAENQTIEKTLEEGCSKAEKEVKGKKQRKINQSW